MESETRLLLGNRNFEDPITWKTKFACVTVLLSETLERIAFYGIVGNLVMFLNEKPLDWTSYSALTSLYSFLGISYLMSFIGGFIADSYLNRFRTIVVFFVIYIIGYIFFPLLTPYPVPEDVNNKSWPFICGHKNKPKNNDSMPSESMLGRDYDRNHAPCMWVVYLGLVIVAIGVGTVKANIAPFGADQVYKKGSYIHRVFFNWFYWCINIGSFISLGAIAYVQQEHSFFWGYIACILCLILALCVFLIGGPVYTKKPASGSILTNVTKVLLEACRMSRRRKNERSMVVSAVDVASNSVQYQPSCLDYAKVRYGGSFHDNMVEDVKSLGKIVLVFFTLIPYWLVYFQMETTFVVQGLHMRLDFRQNGSKESAAEENFRIPTAWLSLFDVIFLLLLLPLIDRVIYPKMDRAGCSPSIRARIILGMLLAVVSVIVAGFVESYRLQTYWKNNTQNIHYQFLGSKNDPTTYKAANMSILWQIPQYAVIGASEAFTAVAGLEMAYMYAPRSMQSVIMGLFWFTQGLGCILGLALLKIFDGVWFYSWDRGDINCRVICSKIHHNETCDKPPEYPHHLPNSSTLEKNHEYIKECHLDYYFFFLAGIQVLGILLFMFVSWKCDIGGKTWRNKDKRVVRPASGNNENNNTGSTTQSGYSSSASQRDLEVEQLHEQSASGSITNGGMSNIQHRLNRGQSTESNTS